MATRVIIPRIRQAWFIDFRKSGASIGLIN
jgi:hypothetical protein